MDSPNQKLVELKALWERKRGDRAMPSRAELQISELKPWLGNLALIDLVGTDGASFRLCGINLRPRFGGDITGCDVTMLSDDIGATICPCLARIRETKTAMSDRHVLIIDEKHVSFDDLALPLSDDGIRIKTILFASYRAKSEEIW